MAGMCGRELGSLAFANACRGGFGGRMGKNGPFAGVCFQRVDREQHHDIVERGGWAREWRWGSRSGFEVEESNLAIKVGE